MKTCVVLTGAGISADSGLQTFRDAGGLWEGHRVEQVATPQAFARDPQLVLDFYNARRRQLQQVAPNAAHNALARLQQHYRVHIITQNVDDLHERAGSRSVLHLHGELGKLRSTVDEHYVVDWSGDQQLSDCDPNGHPLRPHIVWFGEAVPLFDQAVALMRQADVAVVVGTSMQVYPAASLIDFAPRQAPRHLVDPAPAAGLSGVQLHPFRAKEGVPVLVAHLIEQAMV